MLCVRQRQASQKRQSCGAELGMGEEAGLGMGEEAELGMGA